jgi:hypothetical protein
MKYAVLINTIDSAYDTPLLSKKEKRSSSMFAKLLKLFRKDRGMNTETASFVPSEIETDYSLETTIQFQSDKGSRYLSKRFSPRSWSRHSALLSLLEEQQH